MKPAEVGPEQSPGETADQRDAAAATGVRSSRQGELVGAIWEEMRAGWAGGRPLRAEQFLTREFLLACGDEGAVDIIYGEFALAEAHGGKPHASEYLHRFPQFRRHGYGRHQHRRPFVPDMACRGGPSIGEPFALCLTRLGMGEAAAEHRVR